MMKNPPEPPAPVTSWDIVINTVCWTAGVGLVAYAGLKAYKHYANKMREYELQSKLAKTLPAPPPTPEEHRYTNKDSRKWNRAIIFRNKPDEENQHMNVFLRLIADAERTIDIAIDSSKRCYMENILFNLIRDFGVRVRAVVNDSKTAMRWDSYGVEVIRWPQHHEIPKYKPMNHKFLIIDGEAVITGSLNWSMNAMYGHLEDLIVTTDRRTVDEYVRHFDYLHRLFKRYSLYRGPVSSAAGSSTPSEKPSCVLSTVAVKKGQSSSSSKARCNSKESTQCLDQFTHETAGVSSLNLAVLY